MHLHYFTSIAPRLWSISRYWIDCGEDLEIDYAVIMEHYTDPPHTGPIYNIYNKIVYLTNTFISIILCRYLHSNSIQTEDSCQHQSFKLQFPCVSQTVHIVCPPCHQVLFAVTVEVECTRRMMGPWIWNVPIGMTFPFEMCQDVGAKDQESPLNKQQASKTVLGIRPITGLWSSIVNSR